jgi:2-C-methyl-D-erythritol 2,4-cyclodiphosphate synthase
LTDFRIGFGFDVHQLAEGRKMILGGIEIPYSKGPMGHSDADVLLHAICDALLGAAALGDIGKHFPDTTSEFKGADSKLLLAKTLVIIADAGYMPGNIDATLVLETPKISPYISAMQSCISQILRIDADRVSIKATTNEKMGFVGRKEGVAAHAVVLIHSKNGN